MLAPAKRAQYQGQERPGPLHGHGAKASSPQSWTGRPDRRRSHPMTALKVAGLGGMLHDEVDPVGEARVLVDADHGRQTIGQRHGPREIAVPEIARDPRESEETRANRRPRGQVAGSRSPCTARSTARSSPRLWPLSATWYTSWWLPRRGGDHEDAPLPGLAFPDRLIPPAATFARTDGCTNLHGSKAAEDLIPAIAKDTIGEQGPGTDIAGVERALEVGHRELSRARPDGAVDEVSEAIAIEIRHLKPVLLRPRCREGQNQAAQ